MDDGVQPCEIADRPALKARAWSITMWSLVIGAGAAIGAMAV